MFLNKIAQIPFDLINRLLPKINLVIKIERKTFLKRNVFGSNHQKTVLISYLTNPFNKGAENKHTNHVECYLAAKAWNDLGYNVDVVDYDYYKTISMDSYDVIYGFGDQFEHSFTSTNFKGKRIVYSPGCNTVFSNKISSIRLLDFKKNTGILDSRLIRTTNNAWPLQKYLSDAIICQGNDFVLNTYKNDFDLLKYYQINCFPLACNQQINTEHKDFENAKYNLLWFGSQGSVHKGLDIALALVQKNPKLKLYIRGLNTTHEKTILNQYQHLIDNKQVDVKQYVSIDSTEFTELMETCGGVIFPRASEGGAAALLTVMTYGGLIPIITKACGLDIEHLGFVAEESTLTSVENQLHKYLATSNEKLQHLSSNIRKEISETYNTTNYQKNMKAIVQDFLANS
jgi:glycosyltransferase involved in cell wall biosynthesis